MGGVDVGHASRYDATSEFGAQLPLGTLDTPPTFFDSPFLPDVYENHFFVDAPFQLGLQ